MCHGELRGCITVSSSVSRPFIKMGYPMREASGQFGARTKRAFGVPRGCRGAAMAALAFVSSAAPMLAQQTRTISGTVVSGATLTPIEGADVRVQGAATGVLTDVSGRFRLTDVG